jgi:hydroxyquinol 1,2-dioxygenase
LITQLSKKDAEFIESDVVFGGKEKLVAKFKRKPTGETPAGEISTKSFYTVNYDFIASKSET